jgi:hypothetical protein
MSPRAWEGQGEGLALSETQRFEWLRLWRTESVGPRGIMAQLPQAFPRANI